MALSWSSGGVSYFAVSDAAVEELASFVKLFKTAATAGAAPP
jgi:anti-sigma factor RsiW